MSDEPKRHFFKVPDISKMTDEERDAWVKDLHKRMVEKLRPETTDASDSPEEQTSDPPKD
jgi:predicted Fe-S protein YdhL (DUF1289 family)